MLRRLGTWRAAVRAAGVLLCTLALPVAASEVIWVPVDPGATFTVSGAGASYTDVRVDGRFTVDLQLLDVTTSGRWAGVVVRALPSRAVLVAAVLVPDWDPRPGRRPAVPLTNRVRHELTPGHYRIELLAERAATVRGSVHGRGAWTVPTTQRGAAASVSLTDAPLGIAHLVRTPLGHAGSALAVAVAARAELDRSQASHLDACVGTELLPCPSAPLDGVSVKPRTSGSTAWVVSEAYRGSDLPAGPHEARASVVSAGPGGTLSLLAVVVR